MWESQVLLMDGQVVFLRVLQFSPTFDELSAHILERAVKPKSKKKKSQWIFTNFDVCIDIVEICFGIAHRQIPSIFDCYLPMTIRAGYYCFRFYGLDIFLGSIFKLCSIQNHAIMNRKDTCSAFVSSQEQHDNLILPKCRFVIFFVPLTYEVCGGV